RGSGISLHRPASLGVGVIWPQIVQIESDKIWGSYLRHRLPYERAVNASCFPRTLSYQSYPAS
ncbi:6627_t:CDS:2, partial [Acaulospora morrowiae]